MDTGRIIDRLQNMQDKTKINSENYHTIELAKMQLNYLTYELNNQLLKNQKLERGEKIG